MSPQLQKGILDASFCLDFPDIHCISSILYLFLVLSFPASLKNTSLKKHFPENYGAAWPSIASSILNFSLPLVFHKTACGLWAAGRVSAARAFHGLCSIKRLHCLAMKWFIVHAGFCFRSFITRLFPSSTFFQPSRGMKHFRPGCRLCFISVHYLEILTQSWAI